MTASGAALHRFHNNCLPQSTEEWICL